MEFDFIKVNKPLDTPNINAQVDFQIEISQVKVQCALRMVISSEFRMGQYRLDDHREDASHFMNPKAKPDRETIFWPVFLPEFLRVSLRAKNKDW